MIASEDMTIPAIDQVRRYIVENFLFSEDVSVLGLDDSFLERGIVDSTGMLEVILFLEETFGVVVADEEMIPENLDSVRRIAELVQRKRG